MSVVEEVTDASFQRVVLESATPVLVDFWAEWCGPCTPVAATLEEVAREARGRFKICKVNIEENRELALRFEVTKLPCLTFFKNGQKVTELLGNKPKKVILEQLEQLLGNDEGPGGSTPGPSGLRA